MLPASLFKFHSQKITSEIVKADTTTFLKISSQINSDMGLVFRKLLADPRTTHKLQLRGNHNSNSCETMFCETKMQGIRKRLNYKANSNLNSKLGLGVCTEPE